MRIIIKKEKKSLAYLFPFSKLVIFLVFLFYDNFSENLTNLMIFNNLKIQANLVISDKFSLLEVTNKSKGTNDNTSNINQVLIYLIIINF